MDSEMKCYCGKKFFQLNAFSNHQRHCKYTQDCLTTALHKAQHIWEKKRESKRLKHLRQDIVEGHADNSSLPSTSILPLEAPQTSIQPIPTISSEPDLTIVESHPILDLPIAERRNRREIRLPERFRDGLPESLHPPPPPECSTGISIASTSHQSQLQSSQHTPSDYLQTHPNSYGLFRRYYNMNPTPSHASDPDSDLLMEDLCDIPTSNDAGLITDNSEDAPGLYGPYPNRNSFLLGEWNWNDQIQKSKSSFKSLLNIISHPDFRPGDIRETQWDAIDKELGSSDNTGADFMDVKLPGNDAGWTETPITISVPFHHNTPSPGPRDYIVTEFYHRSIITILREALSHPTEGLKFHFEPYELYWQPDNRVDPVRVYGELYTSPSFIDAYRALQDSPPEPGCKLPRVVAGLMLSSDSTQLTSFGDAKIWPQYLYFGNHSKYFRCKPTCRLCYHVAYFQKVPDKFKDFVLSITGGKNVNSDVLTHCNRELYHAQLKIILDDEFLDAYQHGVVITCADGLQRRFYVRLFTYSADYPEKTMIATIRNMGNHPCPRCLVPLSLTDQFGTQEDQQLRIDNIRVDDLNRQNTVSKARKLIYGKLGAKKNTNYGVGSAAVERLLKEQSLVPTENAFSSRLARYGFDVFPMLVVDLLHEVELGVWRSLFIHLLRILECIGPSLAHEMDKRYRATPTFGRDSIRKFSKNCSEMKRMAARDLENLLQCSIPVFEGLLPDEHNETLLTLLFHVGHWHSLAKLKMHTDPSLTIMDGVTTSLGQSLRDFRDRTCSVYSTRELPREAASRRKRQAKAAVARGSRDVLIDSPQGSSQSAVQENLEHANSMTEENPSGNTGIASQAALTTKKRKRVTKAPNVNSAATQFADRLSRLEKSLNLNTYKNHSLGDYTKTIRRYGTTDSFSTESGELEHRTPKKWYLRTSRRGFLEQITQIERRQSRIRRIRNRLTKPDSHAKSDMAEDPSDAIPDPSIRYHIGKAQNNPEHVILFVEKNQRDPAIKNFIPMLKQHLLKRLQEILQVKDNLQDLTAQIQFVVLKGDRIYGHRIIRFNYTTYDVRRAQDIVNPGTTHCNIMLLSQRLPEVDSETTSMVSHPYLYARVLGIYHANVIYTGPGMIDYTPKRMDFLWVRWYERQEGESPNRLDRLSFPSISSEGALGFVDPADVIRCCHVIPRFFLGKRHPHDVGFSKLAHDAEDWLGYYVNRFADRDMVMRYHWGLGIGHRYSWEGSNLSGILQASTGPLGQRSAPHGPLPDSPDSGNTTRPHDTSNAQVESEDSELPMEQSSSNAYLPMHDSGEEVGIEENFEFIDGMEDYENEDLGDNSCDDSDSNSSFE